MASDSIEYLKARIAELEQEVQEREKDLAVYRRELTQANKKLEQLIADLNQELRVVHTIQKHLVPTEIPHMQGFEFSSKFVPSYNRGGDYYDIFEHEDRAKFGLIVSSCSGHMMSALLLSVLLKMTSQIEARRGLAPHALITAIAKELKPALTANDSAEIFYAVFDRRTFTLNYSMCGDILALHHDYSRN